MFCNIFRMNNKNKTYFLNNIKYLLFIMFCGVGTEFLCYLDKSQSTKNQKLHKMKYSNSSMVDILHLHTV